MSDGIKPGRRALTAVVSYELEDDGAAEPMSPEVVWATLEKTFQSPRYRAPMLPQVAIDLMALSSKPDVDINQVVKLLEKDSLLAGRVLKLANSPLYGGACRIQSLRSAITRLGLRELRDVVVEAAMSARIFKTEGYSEAVERIRVHSTAVAHATRVVTRFTSFEAEYGFLCGLLHEVGFSAALVALGDVPRGQPLRALSELWPALETLHEHLGSKVLESWKLPAEVTGVVGHHHSLTIGGVVHPVTALITVAEHLVGELGAKLERPDLNRLRSAQNALGFDEAKMGSARKAVAEVLRAIAQ